jgi:hypothetical protein
MSKAFSFYRLITSVAILASLYLSAAFLSFEFLYIGIKGQLSINLLLLPVILTTAFLVISSTIKHMQPDRFLHTLVNKLLSICLALALGINSLRIISTSFRFNYDRLVVDLETGTSIGMFRDMTFYGIGLFFLLALPMILLQGWLEGKRGQKLINLLMAVLLLGLLLFIVDGFEKGGMGKDIFLNGIKPLTIWIIGSLSLGWARELFYGSMDKEIMTSESKK